MSEPFEVWRRPGAALYRGDCLDVLPTLPEGSVDAVVTDPPAGIAFMGKRWDNPDTFPLRDRGPLLGNRNHAPHKHGRGFANGMHIDKTRKGRDAFINFLSAVMAGCLRVLQPGGYALVWALPRTSHWTATAVEDAGFEIKEKVYHMFGSGFPKSRGSLKPAAEEWVLAWKPARRMTPLNVDECRIASPVLPADARQAPGNGEVGRGGVYGKYSHEYDGPGEPHPESARHDARGRWPANVVLSHVGGPDGCRLVGTKRVKGNDRPNVAGTNGDTAGGYHGIGPRKKSTTAHADADGLETVEAWECVESCPVRLLDEQAGPQKSGGSPSRRVSRFFYVAKASRKDRGEGNDHPTCKSTALMSWLVSLVTKPGGVVLDPFAGSGSTGVACLRAAREFVGVERDAHYFAIARSRLANAEGPLFAHAEGGAAP